MKLSTQMFKRIRPSNWSKEKPGQDKLELEKGTLQDCPQGTRESLKSIYQESNKEKLAFKIACLVGRWTEG